MKIVLLRHGKPKPVQCGKLRASEFHQWIDLYNSSEISQNCLPSAEAARIAVSCNEVVCSDYRRSFESAKLLGIYLVKHVAPLFREIGLPYARWNTPKASPAIWAAVFRMLWFLGYSKNAESVSYAKQRAILAANKLEDIAKRSDSVLYIGHGFMNRYIAKTLLANDWRGPRMPGRKYWEFAIYKCKSS